ncbi:MATE family efflux transporter [Streptococcus chenjunshii]|uniref:Probable multidrug resistance protein NorM n=1 Tax=Streptococcus chenjunshii TaxID=2173853 RepID=A0A372KKJ6_9STRE|nr:MATE family efflux transporter [Streptococcus chenjunshii]AXQ77665.1 MATE family efflux transporter [Streptococcus chenjunshii]RFU50648.1 MATE family efflux transporter [Streptococcus chenjunshii]RFU52821.1 MATE family efflux transporter [Streptococcus chenjunshii]
MNSKKNIIQLALPAMGENILQMLMGAADNFLVAQVGLAAVSGVSVANNIITVYQALFIALGAAVSSLIAKSYGEKNLAQTKRYQSESVFVTLILGLALGLFSLVFGKTVLRLLGTSPSVTQNGGLYLIIVGGLIFGLGLMTTFGALLRAQGKYVLPMTVSLLINLLNALLSACAVLVFNWGVAGVAAATVCSRLLGVLLLGSQLPVREIFSQIRLRADKELLGLALPAAAERLMMRAGDIVIVAIIVKFGTEAVAGNAIGETLTQFNYMPGMAVATAAVILVAHSLGEGNKKDIRLLVRDSYLISLLLMLLIGALIFFFGRSLTGLFTVNTAAVQASLIVLFYSFIGSPAAAGALVFTAVWQGLGQARLPLYATTIGMWGIRIVLGSVLGLFLGLGLAGVWLATLMDNVFRWFFLYCRYRQFIQEK